MLKLKKEVPFEELENYGFTQSEIQRCYYCTGRNGVIYMWENNREITLELKALLYSEEICDKLYDLITAGLVDKVESK